MQLKKSNPASIRQPFGQYVHGIEIPPNSRIVLTSGQLGTSKDDATPTDIGSQARICFENIHAILAEHQMNFSHVIKINGFLTSREDFPEYMKVRDEFIDNAVASTLIIVSGFTREAFKVEIEVIAAAPV